MINALIPQVSKRAVQIKSVMHKSIALIEKLK
jgi:hypothetical protein